jgi:integrase
VFAREDGRPVSHHQVQCKLRRVVSAAGIEDRPGLRISPHTLRRSYASRLIAHGASVVEVASALAHSDPSATLSSYSFAFEEAQRGQQRRARLESAFQGVFADRGFAMATSEPENGPEPLPLAA